MPNCPRARLAYILASMQTQMVAALSSQYEPKIVAKMQKSLAQRVDEWVEKREGEIRRAVARERKGRSEADRSELSQSVLVCAGATHSKRLGGASGKSTDSGKATDALSREEEVAERMDVDVSQAVDAGPERAEGNEGATGTVMQTREGGSNGNTGQAKGGGSDGVRKSINDVLGGGRAVGAKKQAALQEQEDASRKASVRDAEETAADSEGKAMPEEMTGEIVRAPRTEHHPKFQTLTPNPIPTPSPQNLNRNLVSRSPLPWCLCPCVGVCALMSL